MTTTITLDKTTKFILALIAVGLFLNAVPKFIETAHALGSGDRVRVEITNMPRLNVDVCGSCQ